MKNKRSVGVDEGDPWAQTYTGRRLYPLRCEPDQIHPEDICRGLAFQSRFSGQTSDFYSIAQHSVLCAMMARAVFLDDETQKQCLLHDAAEAYLGDLIRPLKHVLPDFKGIERSVWEAIAIRFGVDPNLGEEVAYIDNQALALEKLHLCLNSEEWGDLPAFDHDMFGLDARFRAQGPDEALQNMRGAVKTYFPTLDWS